MVSSAGDCSGQIRNVVRSDHVTAQKPISGELRVTWGLGQSTSWSGQQAGPRLTLVRNTPAPPAADPKQTPPADSHVTPNSLLIGYGLVT